MVNHTGENLQLDNLSVFASHDFGLKNHAKLVFSSMLVGDLNGNKAIPSQILARNRSGVYQYRMRIPEAFVGTPFKLVFVANGSKSQLATSTGESGPAYLHFDRPQTKTLGIIELSEQAVTP